MYKFLLAAAIAVTASFAHQQVIYTPNVEVESGDVNFSIFFAHPFENSVIMEHGQDEQGKIRGLEAAFVVHNGEKKDVLPLFKSAQYSTAKSKAGGYDFTLSGGNFKSAGDYGLVVVPHPYWEPAEELYIQQITKFFVNKGGFDTDWNERIAEGYTEIIPLQNPYNVTVGQVFRGKIVDNEGNPAVGVRVEVELLNFPVNQNKHYYDGKPITTNEKKGTATLITDDNGIFAFVPQYPGFWGFAALFAGSDKEYNGKELEQDPIIWISVEK